MTSSPPEGPARSRRGRSRGAGRPPLPPGFGAIWTTVAVDLIGFGIVFPLLPRYAEDLNVSPTVIGIVVASFSVAQFLFAPVLGRLSDRFGRKPVLIASLVGTAIGSVITGLAGSVWLLLLGRIVDGASGASVSVAQASVADVASEDQRPRLFGLLGAAFGVGFVLGPAIASVAALVSPRLPFFIAAAIAAVNAVVALRRLPETHPRLAPSGAPAAPSLTEVQAAETGPEMGPGGVDPVAHPSRFQGVPTAVLRLIAIAFVALVAFSAFEATFALLLEARFGLTLSATGAVFTVIGLGLVAVQGGLIHPVATKLGETGTLRLGLVCNAAGLLLLAVDGGWLSLVPALALLVLGQGLVTPTMSSAVSARTSADRRGTALGFQQSAGSLARVVGPVMAGALFEHVGVPAPYLVGAALVLVALALVPGS